MRNVSDKSCGENQNTHFVFSNFFLLVEIRSVYKIMCTKYGTAVLLVSDSPVAAVVCLFTATRRILVGYLLRIYGDGIHQ